MATKAQITALLAKAGAKAEAAAAAAAATGSGFVPVPIERIRPLALFLASLPIGRKVRVPHVFYTAEDLNVKSDGSGADLGYRIRKSLTDTYSAVDNGAPIIGEHGVPPFLWVSDYSDGGDVILATRESVPRKTAERLARKGLTAGTAAMSLPLDATQVAEVLKRMPEGEVEVYLAGMAAYADEAEAEGDDEAEAEAENGVTL